MTNPGSHPGWSAGGDRNRPVRGLRRASRHTRKSVAPRVRVTERDRMLLESVGKLRFTTTSQLARLYFKDSRWAANKRMRKLLDAGLVRAWVRSLPEENVYSLTARGRGALGAKDLVLPRELDGNLQHTLMLNEVRIDFALGLPRIGASLAWWRSEWELRTHGRERVIPDALLAVESEGAEQVFALEVENDTRYPRGILKKILRYKASPEIYGEKHYRVLVVGRDARMLERYRLGVLASGLGKDSSFACLIEISDCEALVWKSGGGDAECSFRQLLAREGSESDGC